MLSVTNTKQKITCFQYTQHLHQKNR